MGSAVAAVFGATLLVSMRRSISERAGAERNSSQYSFQIHCPCMSIPFAASIPTLLSFVDGGQLYLCNTVNPDLSVL